MIDNWVLNANTWSDFLGKMSMENALYFFIENYLIAWVFIPIVLIYKTLLFIQLNKEPQVTIENYLYFSHPNVATTHDNELQQRKKFQNLLSGILLGLILLQIILAIPLIINGR